jgi:predicted phage terminase large subunit-like protein
MENVRPNNPEEEREVIDTLLRDKKVRHATVCASFLWFFRLYFAHFVKFETAPFQYEMMRIAEDAEHPLVAIVAFRGSAKSTIMTTAYPIWAALGVQQKRHILILSGTKEKSERQFADIKRELEINELLRSDLGPFQEESSPWGVRSLVIPHLGTRITSGSVGQSIRGMRHGPNRPDLIILDDIEDLLSVRTREGRAKTWEWLLGEVMPAGDIGTRIVVVGNLLHADAVMPRLGRAIESGEIEGVFRKFPVVDERGMPLWPGKYPSADAVKNDAIKLLDESAWQREFMLRIVPTSEQVVWPEWIHTYQTLPPGTPRYKAIGIDLATSLEETRDFTAMVPIAVYGYGDRMRVYVLPSIVNERLSFPDGINRAIALLKAVGGHDARLVIEDNGSQKGFIQQLESVGIRAEGVTSIHNKRSRLAMTTHLLQQAHVLFPEHGAEALTEQLVGFDRETHDDLADAFSHVVNYAMGQNHGRVRVYSDKSLRV